MSQSALPFNRVVLKSGQGDKRLTVPEFEAIPLTQRVRALLEKRVEFYLDQARVEQTQALRALRERL
jgi:hypothetical protein